MRNNIKDFRKSLKMTQEELAERVRVTRQTINAVEQEKYAPALDLAFKLATLFGVGIEDIFIYGGHGRREVKL
ncbi:MAG: helix-turn-helix transcriptional regulator [Nanoarchaeota archaeon]|nr:helix-turn-helix transcriptional regulator [Nanoarchaeota archaeon]MBU2519797.1 helix-turn-helix transcriptional regulator [Nanoarchaeota archaeon]